MKHSTQPLHFFMLLKFQSCVSISRPVTDTPTPFSPNVFISIGTALGHRFSSALLSHTLAYSS
jgi:hypothetical protein